MVATDFFGPLPQAELDLDQIKRWVQYNTDTFHRSISMQGTLFSADFVSGTSGWRITTDGSAEFNEDVTIGGANTTSAQLKIHNVLEHIALFENDGSNYPEDFLTMDAQAEIFRVLWQDLNGVGATLSYGGLRIYGPSHATQAHDIELQDSSQSAILRWDDSGDELVFIIPPTEVARITSTGLQQATPVSIVKARNQDNSANTVSTTHAVALSATLAIPANWNTYDIEAVFTGRFVETGTLTAVRSINGDIRLTNASGTVLGQILDLHIDPASPDNRIPIVVAGYVTAQSATGNVVVCFCDSIANDSNQVSLDDATLIVTAYRTS